MNRNKQYLEVRAKLAGCLLAIAMCLPACTGSVEPEVGGDASSLRLCLSLALPQAITVEPRDGVTVNGVTVTDVRVLQFASDGSLKSNKQYNNQTETKITTDATTGLPTVTTDDTDFEDVSSRFYIVINPGDDLKDVPTDPDTDTSFSSFAESTFLAYTHTEADITSAPQIMVYGPYEYTTTTTTGKKALQLLAKMQHIGARIDVSWTIPADVNLTITSAEVENIPDKYYLYTQPAASLTYKEAQTIFFSGNSFTFYMPENKKGTGKGTTQQEKSMTEKGPGGTLADCTCIVLKGTYKYKADDTAPIEVEYRFYPGADMINNYDIERGKSYQLDITLSGVNSTDARVSITDSNVFSIGDPSGVDHTIIF